MPASHAPASFRHGEMRFVFAARRDGTPGLVELAQGEAETWRDRAPLDLMCPVRDCPDPAIHVVSRSSSGRRDGFAHDSGGEHDGESLNHVQGKAILARWARWAHADATVIEEHPSNPERERIADVMVLFPDGRRIALEAQYAPLTVEKWRERHASYARQGIVDVWFFGHVGSQAPPEHGRLSDLHQEVAAETNRLVWVNPGARLFAGAVTAANVGCGVLDVHAETHGRVETQRMADVRLDGVAGLVSPRLAALDASTARRDAWRAQQAKEDAQADEHLATRRAVEEQQRADEWVRWVETAEGQAAVAAMPDWPSWLDVSTASTIPVHHRIWQWALWRELILPAPILSQVSSRKAAAHIREQFGAAATVDVELLRVPIRAWFNELDAQGRLHRWQEGPKRRPRVVYRRRRVPEDPALVSTPSRRAPLLETDRSPSVAERADADAFDAAKRASESASTGSGACTSCGRPLGAAGVRDGMHLGCLFRL